METKPAKQPISIHSESAEQLLPLDTETLYNTYGGSIFPSAPEIYDSIVDFVKRGIKALL